MHTFTLLLSSVREGGHRLLKDGHFNLMSMGSNHAEQKHSIDPTVAG